MKDIYIKDSKSIAKLIKQRIIKVRFIESKPQQNGKIPREMININSDHGKIININLYSFAIDAANEARFLVKGVVLRMTQDPNENEEEFKEKQQFLYDSVDDIEFFELMSIYRGYQKFEFEHKEYGRLILKVPRQEMGKEAHRYANMVQKLLQNEYI